MRCACRERGQTSTEYMLLVSVIVIAVIAAAYAFVEPFRGGVGALAADASRILSTGSVGPVGLARKGAAGTGSSDPGLDSSAGGAPDLGTKQPEPPPRGSLGGEDPSAPTVTGSGPDRP